MTDTENAVDLAAVRAQVELLAWVKAEKAKLTDIEAAAKAAIQEAMGSGEDGQLDGRTVVTWTTSKRNALNQALLKKLHPEVAAECMEMTEVRRFSVVDQ